MEIYMAQTINLIGSTQPEVANEIIGNSIIKKLPNDVPYFIINSDEGNNHSETPETSNN